MTKLPNEHTRKLLILGACLLAWSAPIQGQSLILDDPLQGSTSGTREGGTFVPGGWKVVGKNDCIYWHIPTILHGAAEFDVRGLHPQECRPGMNDKSELFHMYDYTWHNSDVQYGDPGYRNNPYKHFVRKNGCLASYNNTVDAMEILWAVMPEYREPDTPVLTWDPARTYRLRMEWGPDGAGNSALKIYRDGNHLLTTSVPGTYAPAGHSVRIAASPRRAEDAGAPLEAVFSNVRVWDLDVIPIPGAPMLTSPSAGEAVNTPIVFIAWTGDPHTRYQVRITTRNTPDEGIVWDSSDTTSEKDFAFTCVLADKLTYYAFVRLGSSAGYGPWNESGRIFRVDTARVPPGPDTIGLKGDVLKRNSGPAFNGLGVTYMQALRRCKYDRNRLIADLDFLRSREFNYVRILSMVGWYPAWQGKEIAPVSFTSQNGTFVPAWSDYWQQFRECIDLIYSRGLLTEVTIFADAQLMPDKADRINHMNTLLANLAGREHKVILLEVANEAWQNGFPGQQGIADLREFAQYLADRTDILVAISATFGGTNASLEEMYAGSVADIATEHFTRDISPPEGGWRPVYDCWRLENALGVPPGASNEPIGPGSSVSAENDPIKLVMAAAFAWGANLPMYVYHTGAGVFGDTTFQSMAGVSSYLHLNDILPGEFAGWARNDGKEASAAFTTYANGQANRWWTEVSNPTSGVIRHTGKIKGNEFITLPIGIFPGGVELESRRPMSFRVYDPLTGQSTRLTKNAGDRFTLGSGPGAYIIRGAFLDLPGGNEVTIDLGAPDVSDGIIHPQGGDGDTTPAMVGGRSARRNTNANEDYYFYFDLSEAFAFQGNRPELFVTIDYYDAGTGTLSLQYDSNAGNDLPAFYQEGGSVVLTNTNSWKTRTFRINDAFFGNRQNSGADLRIGHIGGSFYLDKVRVRLGFPTDYDADGDVDQDDFGHFQRCLSGSGQAPPAGCADADLDVDGDVDGTDLTLFAACLSGAGRSPGC
jgi:hypothetical protein